MMTSRPVFGTALAAVAAAALAGQAMAAVPKAKSDCFYSRNIDGFQAVDRETVNIRVGVRDVYQLKLLGSSPDIDWTNRIAVVSRGGSFICSGLDATVVVPSNLGPQRYPVSSIRKLDPAEIAALPKNQKP
jgi:hypothetical protein